MRIYGIIVNQNHQHAGFEFEVIQHRTRTLTDKPRQQQEDGIYRIEIIENGEKCFVTPSEIMITERWPSYGTIQR
jgi:hypothetical protein